MFQKIFAKEEKTSKSVPTILSLNQSTPKYLTGLLIGPQKEIPSMSNGYHIYCKYLDSHVWANSVEDQKSSLNRGCTVCHSSKTFHTGHWLINLKHSLNKFSRWQTDYIFPQKNKNKKKKCLSFQANCLLRKQFSWYVKPCYLGGPI